jgi:hypothetical protein
VGTGFIPVTGDTASFTWSANTAVAPVYTYNSSTSTWTAADGQVINGNVFITGSVNANRLNANDIYALKLQSTNANFGNNSSNGFWFDSTSGNARIAGNVSIGSTATIGNNLVIANNCSIGGNLTVAGLITGNGAGGANLNSNTVFTTTVVSSAITATDYFSGNQEVALVQNPTQGSAYPLGTLRGVNVSSSGNVLTFTDTFLTNFTLIVGQKLVKLSGTGTLAANTVITSIVNDTQIRVSPTPTAALSGATVISDPVMDINVRTAPGLYITTTEANQPVQLNFSGTFNADGSAVINPSLLYADTIGLIIVVRYPYVLGQTLSATSATAIYSQEITFPSVFRSQFYSQNIAYSLSSVVDEPPTAGTYVYSISLLVQQLNGTWTYTLLRQGSLASSGTVLKR